MSIGDLKENEKLRNELHECLRETLEFKKGLEKTKKFIHYLKNNNGCNDDFSFAYYMIALFYKELNNVKYAISNLKKSNQYYPDKDEEMKNKWVEAELYELYNKQEYDKKAIKLYTECLYYFKSRNMKESCAILLCNIGHLTNDELMIRRGIKLYSEVNYITPSEKINMLEGMNSYLTSVLTYDNKKKIEV